jgi:hypothetical protein
LLFEFELLLELLFEFELELLFEFEFEFEFELLLELLLLFEFELELELELLFELELLLELELLSEPAQLSPATLQSLLQPSSSAMTGEARNDVAMNATVAALVMVFIGGSLLYKKQPSVTASR